MIGLSILETNPMPESLALRQQAIPPQLYVFERYSQRENGYWFN